MYTLTFLQFNKYIQILYVYAKFLKVFFFFSIYDNIFRVLNYFLDNFVGHKYNLNLLFYLLHVIIVKVKIGDTQDTTVEIAIAIQFRQ